MNGAFSKDSFNFTSLRTRSPLSRSFSAAYTASFREVVSVIGRPVITSSLKRLCCAALRCWMSCSSVFTRWKQKHREQRQNQFIQSSSNLRWRLACSLERWPLQQPIDESQEGVDHSEVIDFLLSRSCGWRLLQGECWRVLASVQRVSGQYTAWYDVLRPRADIRRSSTARWDTTFSSARRDTTFFNRPMRYDVFRSPAEIPRSSSAHQGMTFFNRAPRYEVVPLNRRFAGHGHWVKSAHLS